MKKELKVPKEQLQLSEKDLSNEITKVLQAQNPDAPHNIVQFSHKERVYKATAQVDQTMIHYGQDGLLMHSSSDDAKKQKRVLPQDVQMAIRTDPDLAAPFADFSFLSGQVALPKASK